MQNKFLMNVYRESINALIITDKRGANIFFPWGNGKKGYYISDERLIPKIKKFYTASLVIFLVIFFASAFLWENPFYFIGSLFICSVIWLTIWYSYARNITKSLTPSPASYTDLNLERDYEVEDKEDEIEEPS